AQLELSFAPVTFTDGDGRHLENVHVLGINPVSIFYRMPDGVCCGESRLAKLPEHLQKQFGYEPKRAAEHEEAEARSAAGTTRHGRSLPVLARYPGVASATLA